MRHARLFPAAILPGKIKCTAARRDLPKHRGPMVVCVPATSPRKASKLQPLTPGRPSDFLEPAAPRRPNFPRARELCDARGCVVRRYFVGWVEGFSLIGRPGQSRPLAKAACRSEHRERGAEGTGLMQKDTVLIHTYCGSQQAVTWFFSLWLPLRPLCASFPPKVCGHHAVVGRVDSGPYLRLRCYTSG
ncbi:MAG: hypothetical protein KatS3mg027_0010 [Bacteroidia bacterium]|nr:MAG: hypothetical protein KatS3mg027_0010 [Bacteroidia bacterium]